jgi:hypothetical protein
VLSVNIAGYYTYSSSAWRRVVENSTCKNTTGSADQTVRRLELHYLFCVCAYDLRMDGAWP